MKRLFFLIISLFSFVINIAGNGYSGTIPVLFIFTEDNQPVQRKDTTIKAGIYLETFGWKGYQPIGTPEKPLDCEIKCRGNWTFTSFEKKPYKIKLTEKHELLGMPKNKHWVLLAHADDRTGFLRNSIGFEVARMLNMKYVPRERPVEVVLNGNYEGLYMLTEHVRVGKYRVDIEEQRNGETDAGKIKDGGWLVEIDNYEREGQIKVDTPDDHIGSLNLTYHSPDSLSDQQAKYLEEDISNLISAIFDIDKSQMYWKEDIDIDELVKYCINTEVTAHEEAYFGSTFLYKPNGRSKWIFGPVWDFGNSIVSCWKQSFTWEPENNLYGYNIMTEISRYPEFKKEILGHWPSFYSNSDKIMNFVDSIVSDIRVACEYNAKRWPQYSYENYGSDEIEKAEWVKATLLDRITWLNSKWGGQESDGILKQYVGKEFEVDKRSPIYDIKGRKIIGGYKGIKISNGKKYK